MILRGDCLEVLRTLDADSIDSVVTDPPYGLSKEPDIDEVMQHWINGDAYEHKHNGFMGKSWDSFVPGPEYWREVFRVLKPGAHIAVFCGTRTWDLMSVAIRFAGFENRDTIASIGGPPAVAWVTGQGFPKAADISKQIDKMAGAEREIVSIGLTRKQGISGSKYMQGDGKPETRYSTRPTTDDAKKWEGWKTAIKPAWEVILIFRKPVSEKTVSTNVLRWGTGALNIDASRVSINKNDPNHRAGDDVRYHKNEYQFLDQASGKRGAFNSQGRFPANLILSCNCGKCEDGQLSLLHDEACAVGEIDRQSGVLKSGGKANASYTNDNDGVFTPGGKQTSSFYGSSGGASRFFYCAKTSKAERNAGLQGMPGTFSEGARPNSADATGKFPDHDHRQRGGNNHPTVKPLKLMQYLINLITPPGGTVLDCFAGSGSTGVAAIKNGFHFIGIERELEYAEIAEKRIEHAKVNA